MDSNRRPPAYMASALPTTPRWTRQTSQLCTKSLDASAAVGCHRDVISPPMIIPHARLRARQRASADIQSTATVLLASPLLLCHADCNRISDAAQSFSRTCEQQLQRAITAIWYFPQSPQHACAIDCERGKARRLIQSARTFACMIVIACVVWKPSATRSVIEQIPISFLFLSLYSNVWSVIRLAFPNSICAKKSAFHQWSQH